MKIILLLCVFFIYSCSNKQKNVPILQEDSITEDFNVIRETILDEKYGYDYFNRTLRDDRIIRYKQSKEHFLKAQRLKKNNEYEAALLELEQAIQLCSQGVYYYHYGNYLIGIKDYINAEKSFLKALQFFDYSDPFNEDYNSGNENPLYTFDNNGAPREEYFTYYNLACLYSIQNKLDSSFNYLKEALEHGYPYINHLFNDVDLSNLLNSSDYTRNQIQKIYDDGFINEFSGETYINSYASYSANYIFINDTDIRKSVSNESNSSYYGIYEIKNYNIIINYKRETGRRGYGEIIIATGNGNIYEKYEPYDKEIDESQILSIKKILNSQEWELFTIKRIENSREMVITSIEEILSR